MALDRVIKVLFTGDASKFAAAVGDAERATEGWRNKLANVGESMTAMGQKLTLGVTVPIVAMAAKTINDLGNLERINAQTKTVIESTGGAAGVSAKHVEGFAQKIEKLTGVEQETIQEGQNLLLTFTDIQNKAGAGNDIFDQATKTIVDMSQALGQDTKTSAMQLGKALNDPIRGITALQRVGLDFSDQQRDQVKAMVEAGDTMGAQKLILAELNKQVGGSAEAWGNTLPGKIAKAKNAFGNMAETLVVALMPAIHSVTSFVTGLLERFEKLSPGAQKVIGIVIALAAVLGPLLIVLGAIATAISAISLPVLAVVAAIAALVAGVIYAYRNWEWFREAVQNVAKWLKDVAWPAIKDFAANIKNAIQPLVQWWKEHWDQIKEAVGNVFKGIKAYFDVYLAIYKTLWNMFGDEIIAIAKTVWNFIAEIVNAAIDVVRNIIEFFLNILTGKWGAAWDNILGILRGAWDIIFAVLRGAVGIVGTLIGGVLEGIKNAFVAAFNFVKDTVQNGINTVLGFITSLPDRIASFASSVFNAAKGIGSAIIDGIKNGIGDLVDMAGDFGDGIAKGIKGIINKLIDKLNNGIPDRIKIPFAPDIDLPNNPIPRLASGGITTGPTLAVVGDNPGGREAIIPLPKRGDLLGGGTTIVLNVQGSVVSERQLVDALYEGLLAKKQRVGDLGLA